MSDQTLTDEEILSGDYQIEAPKSLTDDEVLAGEFTVEAPTDKTISAAYGVAQGLTFDWADEIAAASIAFMDNTEYRTELAKVRAKFKQAEVSNPKTFFAGQLAGGATAAVGGLFITPLASIAATGTGMIATASVGGAIASVGASEDAEFVELAKDAMTGAALGAATGSIFAGAATVINKLKLGVAARKQATAIVTEELQQGNTLAAKEIQDIAEALEDKSLKIADAAAEIKRELPEKFTQMTYKVVGDEGGEIVKDNTNSIRFRQWLLGKDPTAPVDPRDIKNQFERVWDSYTPEAKQASWNNFVDYQANLQAATKTLNSMEGIKDPLEINLWTKLQDPMFRSMEVDNMLGTQFEHNLNQIVIAGRKTALTAQPYLNRLEGITSGIRKHFGRNNSQLFVDAMEGSPVALRQLTPAQKSIVLETESMLKDFRGTMKELGVDLKEVENYFPRTMAKRADVYRAMRDEHQRLLRSEKTIESDEFADFAAALNILSNGKIPKTSQGVNQLIEGLRSPAKISDELLQRFSSASYSRGSTAIPEFIRDIDPSSVLLKYISTNLKTAYLREPLQQLNNNIGILRTLGAQNTLKFYEREFQRLTGQPSTAKAVINAMGNNWKIMWDDYLAKAGDSTLKKLLGSAAKETPTILGQLTNHAYANLLGWNPYAPLRNLTQTLMVTAPELEGIVGMSSVAKGWLKTLKAKDHTKFLQQHGWMGTEFTGEAERKIIGEGLARAGVVQHALDKFTKIGMWAYAKSDVINRHVTYHVGQEVGDLIVNNSPKVFKFTKNLPAGIKQQIRVAMRRQDDRAVKEIVSDYLIRKTQFNYGPDSLFQFGQDFGSAISMFSKWASVIGSDLHYTVKTRKGIDKAIAPMQKYIAPLVLLAMGDQILNKIVDREDPTAKMFLGNSLVNLSPLNSVMVVGLPPIAQIPFSAGKAGKEFLQGDIKRASKTLKNSLLPFVPVIGAYPKVKQTTEGIINKELD